MKQITKSAPLFLLGCLLGAFLLHYDGVQIPEPAKAAMWIFASGAFVVGMLVAIGVTRFPTPWGVIDVPDIDSPVSALPARVLPREIEQERRHFAAQKEDQLPGRFAAPFRLLDEKIVTTGTPCADPMTPMYMLDRNFRIIDWNIAFGLCFDGTLEGRRGSNILEWTYFLDNYEDILDHGIAAFGQGKDLPRIDVEEIRYTSHRYGPITAIKRAYQIPDDDGSCLGWLITIRPTFENDKALRYQSDLLSALRKDLMWSDYALSYDRVLNQSQIYPALIRTLIGQHQPGPPPIPGGTVVLDLGAGTGNLTVALADPATRRLIVSIDDNVFMLNCLREKCAPFLRSDAEGPGVIPIKQDISSLYGLNDGFFDVVVLNNVLYSLEPDAMQSCLREIYRVLKAGGEFRISEPKKTTRLSKVLDQIGRDLRHNSGYAEIEADYQKVRQINERALAPMLQRWTIDEMKSLLGAVGFERVTYETDAAYAGQSMLICVQK